VVNFSNAIRKAKEYIMYYKEQVLLNNKNPAGIIFDLKNNSRSHYKDKIDVEGGITVGVSLSQLTSGAQANEQLAPA